MIKKFTEVNKKLWQDLPTDQPSDKKILIAEARSPRTIHGMGLNSIMLKIARDYEPMWLGDFNEDQLNLMQSYVPSASTVPLPLLSSFEKFKINVITLLHFILVKLNFKIIRLRFLGIRYGDLLYDQYLRNFHVATIRKVDKRFMLLIKSFIHFGIRYDKALKGGDYDAVMTVHRIGRSPGLITRLAAKYGMDVYNDQCEHYSTLYRTATVEEAISFHYEPLPSEIDALLSKEDFDERFHEFMVRHLEGDFNKDAAMAYAEKASEQLDRHAFCEKYNLDPGKKMVFVMLHAFTDFPHSHFGEEMIFNDYYDWFKQTLDYAKKDDSVNWVFKQHPSIAFYPTKDVDYDGLFSNCGKQIRFVDENETLNAMGVAKVADVVITCIGSAGFEIPSLGSCYSITPAPNHYSRLNFTIRPRSIKEYFKVLADIPNSKSLSPEKKRIAKAVFMFINKYSKVNKSAIPNLTFAQFQDTNMEEWYYDAVLEKYDAFKDKVKTEILEYAELTKAPDFRALRSV